MLRLLRTGFHCRRNCFSPAKCFHKCPTGCRCYRSSGHNRLQRPVPLLSRLSCLPLINMSVFPPSCTRECLSIPTLPHKDSSTLEQQLMGVVSVAWCVPSSST